MALVGMQKPSETIADRLPFGEFRGMGGGLHWGQCRSHLGGSQQRVTAERAVPLG